VVYHVVRERRGTPIKAFSMAESAIETRLQKIEERNARVELDKKWEGSWTRHRHHTTFSKRRRSDSRILTLNTYASIF